MSKLTRRLARERAISQRNAFDVARHSDTISLPDVRPETIIDVDLDNRVFNPTRGSEISLPEFNTAAEQVRAFVNGTVPRSRRRTSVSVSRRLRPVDLWRRPTDVEVSWLRKTYVCARRKIRKEVMFALGMSGRGKGSRKRRRFTKDSLINCRR